MIKCIDNDRLLSLLEDVFGWSRTAREQDIARVMINTVRDAPAVAIVERRRCDKCDHYGGGMCLEFPICGDDASYAAPEPDDYCSRWEPAVKD